MLNRLFTTIKSDWVLLILMVLLCISISVAIIKGTSNLSGIGFIYLSVAIVGAIFTRRWNSVKNYLVLTAASVLGFFMALLLYNIIHRLFQYWFGADFWESTFSRDEFFFFSIAVFICPVGFIIGVAGSIHMAVRKLTKVRKLAETVISDEAGHSP